MRRSRAAALALATLLAVAGAACSNGNGGAGPSPQPSRNARPQSTAQVAIAEPTPGQTFTASDVPVKITLTGGRIIEAVSSNLKPDEGHVHLKLDGKTVDVLAGLDETLTGVAKGRHLLEVEFVAADHGPFDPRVLATVTFTVA